MRSLLIAVLFALPATAQPKSDELPTTRLTLSAAPAPIPPLRYELLPSYRDQVAGNAALSYHRAMLLKGEPREADRRAEGMRDVQIEEMAAKPLNEVNRDELRAYLANYRLIFREMENGAKRDHCDWDLEKRIDAEGVGVLLPEVQKMRELARLLSLRCRLHMAEGKINDALHDIQIGFAMARHVGDGPTLIQSLVGMAFVHIFAGRLEEIIALKDSPNMYWALTALPRPYLDMRRPLEGEMRSLEGTLPMLRELDKGPLAVDQARKLLDQWAGSLTQITGGNERMRSPFLLAGMVALQHPKAKKSLLAMGRTEAEVNAMPAAQVVLLDSVLRFKGIRDEMFIWFHLPYPEARQGLARTREHFQRSPSEAVGDVFMAGLFSLLPAVDKVHYATARMERRIAQLRTIEAVRLHAAESGHFPDQLADIRIVPVPLDPTTNKPFHYERAKDGKAVLYGPPPSGETAHVGNAFRYELTLRK